jgi:hypothetical protein
LLEIPKWLSVTALTWYLQVNGKRSRSGELRLQFQSFPIGIGVALSSLGKLG